MACPLFFVFLRKNLIFLRFYWIPFVSILISWIAILFGYLHWTVKPTQYQLDEFEVKDYNALKLYMPSNDFDLIYYAPKIQNVEDLMENVRNELQITVDRFRAYNNSFDMQLDMEQQCRGDCFAINFENIPEPGSPGHFKYSLSSNRMRISPKIRFVNDLEINHQKNDDEYIRWGFLTLQNILDIQYIKYQGPRIDYNLLLNSLPNFESSGGQDSYRLVNFGTLFSILFVILLLSTFIVPFVEEKQNGLKEFLNLVTPMSFLNGLTFFIIRFFCYLGFLIAVFILANQYKALGLINIGYIFTLYLLYIIATTSYAYLISVCFHSVFYARIGSLVILVIPYAFSFVRSWATQLAFVFFSTNTFLEGLDVFQTFSNKHRTFTGCDLFRQIKDGSNSIFSAYVMLIFQTLLYALLYNYFVCVFPGPGGLKRSFLFFLDPNTYKKRQRNEYTTSPRGTHAIIISNLYKKFQTIKRETLIADDLSMNINNKEITVLLGHNGAGKTTMMNMIMGLIPKDSGKIVVCSERDVASYRHLIGFCPQHSVFMSYMTCQQHLKFFAELRGANNSEAHEWAERTLKKLNLAEKANEYGQNLSGGMKRRLSLGIAIAGNTKIVILDEPSSGLDIESRRELWDILLNLRKEKAILITTHYMEEAEVLGDTICILANGRLQCCGSPLELKRKSNRGYRLKLEITNFKFRKDEIMDLINKHIPGATFMSMVKPTVYICLPYEFKTKFQEMLKELEEKAKELDIDTISITDTSLEDVFLNCAGEVDQVDTPDGSRNDAPLLKAPYKRLNKPDTQPPWWQLWLAVFYKKWTFVKNEFIYACVMHLIPMISVCCAILIMHALSVVTNEAALPLKLSEMQPGIVYIYNPTGHHAQIEQQLRQQIELSGLQAKTLILRGNNNVQNELLELQRENLADFLQDVVGVIDMYADGQGAGITPTILLYYASNRYHSSVALINLIDTTMLKINNQAADIDATYLPIRRFVSDISPTRLEYYAVIVSVGMFFYMFYYVSLPFREHANGFRQLQTMSRYTYWGATFTFDVLVLIFNGLILYVIQASIMPKELYNCDEIKLIVVSIVFYGCSYLPILYCLANNLKSISTISTYLLLMLTVSAIAPLITSGNPQAMKLHNTKILFLRILPDFNLNHQLRIINENFIASRRPSKMSDTILPTDIFFSYALFVWVNAMIFFTVILENKYRRQSLVNLFRFHWTNDNKKNAIASQIEDCQREETRVKELMSNPSNIIDYPLIVSNLSKRYSKEWAVDGLSFAAAHGECFGLLGVNGAGKTSTFQMIAANLTIDKGNILIDGIDVRIDEVAFRYRFGYCPQNDAINSFMTAEQCLWYMAMIRGLKWVTEGAESVRANVEYWLDKMHLVKYRDVKVNCYSGGTKRKLLAAMSMIGAPSLVLLDEPTTGVDPISRRFLWQCIKDFQSLDRTVVLTSHSMDECEELCNRLAIMAKGKFKCLNNICALKRFSGFTIKLKMIIDTETEENVNEITRSLKSQFTGLELRENHAGTLTYFVGTQEQILWSNVFKITEDCLATRLRHIVDDYSVNECTLEDIFLKFDKEDKALSRNNSVECCP